MNKVPILSINNLVKHFPLGGGLMSKPKAWVKAVDGITFDVHKGENFGFVGESGCGKTTLGQMIVRLINSTSGSIEFNGTDITRLSRAEMRPLRQQMQIIFQDPYSSLDPRMKVESIVIEPLRAQKRLSRTQRREAAGELLEKVGLKRADLDKYPHEFSGGQRQRIGIARALCVKPDLIVADEPVSALDVSIQAQVINLMEDLKNEFNLSYIFISHDISVIEHVCNRIAVMYMGVIVEIASTEDFCQNPQHPYSKSLLAAVLQPDPHVRTKPFSMEGDVPSPIDPPPGCSFHPRCQYTMDTCQTQRPTLVEIAQGHYVACWFNDGHGI